MEWVKSNLNYMEVPIYSWCKDVAENTLTQALSVSQHPLAFHHMALMGDAGYGYGMPIGGVMACKDGVIPYAVGKDIGCGVRSVKTSLRVDELNKDQIVKIRYWIKKTIPVGFKHHETPQNTALILPDSPEIVTQRESKSIFYQLGTLGGGNHFIEIQVGDDGHIYFMIHCGSRNFGSKVCDYYNTEAKKLNKLWHSDIDERWDLAFLPIGSNEARKYIEEMKFAMRFAFENRRLISNRVKESFRRIVGCEFEDDIDIHHNYAALENHFGKNVWVHRKGATSARKGQIGLIPGSMGTSSYIVKGLGNRDSFMSCSHGAGRPRSCTESSKILSVEECSKAMEGIVFDGWGKNRKGNIDLGEAPGAYKDIEGVIESQKDLVIPKVKLRPLGVVKAISENSPWRKKNKKE